MSTAAKAPMFRRFCCLTGLCGLVLMTGCANLPPYGPVRGPATYYRLMALESAGHQRAYRVHLPPAYGGDTPLPLVVVVHGAFDTARGIEKISGFSRLADRENFIVLYPEGIGIFGLLQHWNAGHCCGKAADDGIDDVGYLAAAIEEVAARLAVDRRRIYMVGFSNGGMMTHRFAAERTDLLAAAAPMAASIGGRATQAGPEWSIPPPKRPLPILILHGLDDDDVRFEGGPSLHRGGERRYYSVERSLDFWAAANKCTGAPAESQTRGGAIQTRLWEACAEGAVTALTTIGGWGHIWPGPYFTADLPAHHPLVGYDAAGVVWDFFKRFP
jgi:polyhydroxybutyrate depolymerase